MPVISIFSFPGCQGEEITRRVSEELGYRILDNTELIENAAKRYRTSSDKIARSMHGPRSVFDRLTHEKNRNIEYIRATLAELIKDDGVVYHGFAGLLLPRKLSQVLKVCLVAKPEYRLESVLKNRNVSEREAKKIIEKADESSKQWTLHLFGLAPWDESLHDVILPMDSTAVDAAVQEICTHAAKPPLKFTPAASKAIEDFLLSSRASVALAEKGYDVDVESDSGTLTLTINKYVMRLEAHEKELKKVVSSLAGVKDVLTKVGPHFNQPNIYPKIDLPKKILLVDDEKEFVHTLSERLHTRNLESAVAYDGEQALSIMENDAPEVMVLDLKMPGIDGLEVLRRVKLEHPATEVIILTGHGSDAEKKLADELGAFAYLQKPVDIDVLAETMKEAYSKVAESKNKEKK